MIKTAILYKLNPGTLGALTLTQCEEMAQANAFIPCQPTQEKSAGWVPARGEDHGPLIECAAGQSWILKLKTETKTVPGAIITKKAKEHAAQIEATTGRKPGKKELAEIKSDIKLALLPAAFAKEADTLVWIDHANDLLVIAASSQARADEVATLLVKTFDGLSLALIDTQTSPVAAMSDWLITQEPPQGFTVDRECELKAADESKATIKYGRHPLDIDEVKANVASGKLPTKLALTWNSRVSFVLTEGLQLKKIEFLDVVFVDASQDGKSTDFDANVAIMTGELRGLIPDLVDALGGYTVPF